MRRHNRAQQGTEGDENHGHHFGRYFLKEAFQIGQCKRGQNRRKYLRLIADHIDFDKAEIPLVDRAVGQRRGHGISVGKLSGNERQAEDNAQHFRTAHFFHDGPADADRNAHMEDRFAQQPEKVINSGPELALTDQRRAVEDFHAVNDVAEAENQTASDNSRDQRRENLRKGGHEFLQNVLVLLGHALDLFFGDAGNAGDRREIVIEIRDFIADDHLELSRLRERSLDRGNAFNLFDVGPFGVHQHIAHTGDAVGRRRDIFAPANCGQQRFRVLCKLAHTFPPPKYVQTTL